MLLQCIAQHDQAWEKPKDPFSCLVSQGLQTFEEHLRTLHGVIGRKDNQLTIGAAFSGEGQTKKSL